jgi:hypothetical protein
MRRSLQLRWDRPVAVSTDEPTASRATRRATPIPAAAVVLCCLVAGATAQSALADPPNDNRGAAHPTTGHNVNLLWDNWYDDSPFGETGTEAGELRSCTDPDIPYQAIPPQFDADSDFDSTVWFSYDPPAAGTAVYSVAGGSELSPWGDVDEGNFDDSPGIVDTVMWLYNQNGSPAKCDDDSGNGLQSQVSEFYGSLNPSPVLIQVGGYDDGSYFERGNFTFLVNFSQATRVAANLRVKFDRFANFLRITKAFVIAESGSTIRIRCKGSCGFKGTKVFSQGPINLKKLLSARLRFGTAIDVFVTEPGRFGYYARYKIKPKPRKIARCLAANVLVPTRANISQCPT